MLKNSLRVALLLPVLFFLSVETRAQGTELDCPSGQQRAIFPGSVTINPANGKQRFNFCIVAATGHMVYQGDATAPIAAGSNKQIQFNDAGNLAGNPNLLWDKVANTFTVNGDSTLTDTSGLNSVSTSATGINIFGFNGAISMLANGVAQNIGMSSLGGSVKMEDSTGAAIVEVTNDTKLGFYTATPIVKPTVSGSDIAALGSLLTKLASLGLITNSTTTSSNYKVQFLTFASCTIVAGTYNECVTTAKTWPTAFSDATYGMSCTAQGTPTDGGNKESYIVYEDTATPKTATQFVVRVQNNRGTTQVDAVNISCIGVHL